MLLVKFKHWRIFLFALSVALAFASTPSSASAQTVTGTLQGTVYDSGGAVVPGVEIVVTNLETGQERTLRTNNEGAYVATYLPIGRYSVKASGQGFTAATQESLEVTLNQTRVAD